MPGDSGRNGPQRRSRAQSLVLLVAGLWLLIAFACIADPWPIAAAAVGPRALPMAPTVPVTGSIVPTPTDTPGAAPPTATPPGNSGGNGTPTTGTPTTIAGPTATSVATATATSADTGGGYQGSGPQPTRVVVAIATAGAGGPGGLQALSPAAFGSNGLLVAMTLSCVIAILGLVIAVIAMNVLIRTGYGPFLRVLLLGNRAEGRAFSDVSQGGRRAGRWARWDDDEYGTDGGNFGGGAQQRGAPALSRSPQRQAPPSRSRSDWR